MPNDIILIGPVRTGKSTIAELLCQRLGLLPCPMDTACWYYYKEQGYDDEYAQKLRETEGFDAFHTYIRQFYPEMVERFLQDNTGCIMDFGGGHSVYNDPGDLDRVRKALEPYPNVVLLLPSPDPDESLRILDERADDHKEVIRTMNLEFANHPANFKLAKFVVYTKGKTPEETCDEILAQVVLS